MCALVVLIRQVILTLPRVLLALTLARWWSLSLSLDWRLSLDRRLPLDWHQGLDWCWCSGGCWDRRRCWIWLILFQSRVEGVVRRRWEVQR